MLSVTDEFKGAGLVFTMLRKCFGEDFDAKRNCSQVAFTKDYKVCVNCLKSEVEKRCYIKLLLSLCHQIRKMKIKRNPLKCFNRLRKNFLISGILLIFFKIHSLS